MSEARARVNGVVATPAVKVVCILRADERVVSLAAEHGDAERICVVAATRLACSRESVDLISEVDVDSVIEAAAAVRRRARVRRPRVW